MSSNLVMLLDFMLYALKNKNDLSSRIHLQGKFLNDFI